MMFMVLAPCLILVSICKHAIYLVGVVFITLFKCGHEHFKYSKQKIQFAKFALHEILFILNPKSNSFATNLNILERKHHKMEIVELFDKSK